MNKILTGGVKMNIKTECEQCGKEIIVSLVHWIIRKIFRKKEGFRLLCTKCYFEVDEV